MLTKNGRTSNECRGALPEPLELKFRKALVNLVADLNSSGVSDSSACASQALNAFANDGFYTSEKVVLSIVYKGYAAIAVMEGQTMPDTYVFEGDQSIVRVRPLLLVRLLSKAFLDT